MILVVVPRKRILKMTPRLRLVELQMDYIQESGQEPGQEPGQELGQELGWGLRQET